MIANFIDIIEGLFWLFNRKLGGKEMRTFFILLIIFAAALGAVLYFVGNTAFSDIEEDGKSATAVSQLPSMAGTVIGADTVRAKQPAAVAEAKNGFNWGEVSKDTNQAWINLWSLLLTVPITFISAIFAIKIAMRAEKLSEGERPEYQVAVETSNIYAKLKSLYMIYPSMLKQAHRLRAFDGNFKSWEYIAAPTERLKEPIESNLPFLLEGVAVKTRKFKNEVKTANEIFANINGRLKSAEHLSRLFASFYFNLNKLADRLEKRDYGAGPDAQVKSESGQVDDGSEELKNIFMHTLHAGQEILGCVDDLIVHSSAITEEMKNVPSDDERKLWAQRWYGKDGKIDDVFTETEYCFVRQSKPVASLRYGVKSQDLINWANEIARKNACKPFGRLMDEIKQNEVRLRSALVCDIHDTAVQEVIDELSKYHNVNIEVANKIEDIDSLAKSGGNHEPRVYIITEDLDLQLIKLAKLVDGHNNTPPVYLIIHNADRYQTTRFRIDKAEYRPMIFSLDDHIVYAHLFSLINKHLEKKAQTAEKEVASKTNFDDDASACLCLAVKDCFQYILSEGLLDDHGLIDMKLTRRECGLTDSDIKKPLERIITPCCAEDNLPANHVLSISTAFAVGLDATMRLSVNKVKDDEHIKSLQASVSLSTEDLAYSLFDCIKDG